MIIEEEFPRSELKNGVLSLDKRKRGLSEKLTKTKHIDHENETDETVSYKNYKEEHKIPTLESIRPGSLVLGSVAMVTDSGLRIHILNDIVGFAKNSELVDCTDSNEERGNNKESSSFSVGSNVVCYVLEVFHSYVSLSLKPSVINRNLRPDNMFPGLLLPVTVLSQEDHGFIVTFDATNKGNINEFIKYDEQDRESVKKELTKRYTVNSTAYLVVESVNLEKGLIKYQWPWTQKSSVDLKRKIFFENLKPGLLVSGEIKKVHKLKSENEYHSPLVGYTVKCLGSLTAQASFVHSVESFDVSEDPEENSKMVGDVVKGRVIHVDHERKLVHISLIENILRWKGPLGQAHKKGKNPVITCKVTKVLGSGLVLKGRKEDNNENKYFFCSVKDALEDKGVSDSTILTSTKYKEGTDHQCRVLEFNYLTRLTQVSLKRSAIEEKYVSPLELEPSEIVKGKIIKVINTGAIVEISRMVQGKVPLGHLTQVPLTKVPENIQKGRNLKMRVLKFDHPNNKLILTAKKVLVEDENPLVRFDQLYVGKELTGCVINRKEKNYGEDSNKDRIIIKFYNGLQTLLDEQEVERAKKNSINLNTDSVIKCAVTKVDSKKHNFYVTIDTSKITEMVAKHESRKKLRRNKRKMACKEAFKNHVSTKKKKAT